MIILYTVTVYTVGTVKKHILNMLSSTVEMSVQLCDVGVTAREGRMLAERDLRYIRYILQRRD